MESILKTVLLAASVIFLLLFAPDAAHAWGPGVHMVTGNWILQSASVLPQAVAVTILGNTEQFFHGILCADIFIGKGSRAREGHSHNWAIGFELLERATVTRKDHKLAYAYGYLSHLAADIVAHNVFVPGLFHTAPGSEKMAHVFLEAQADRLLDWDSVHAQSVFECRNSVLARNMLRQSMCQTCLPFNLKTFIFKKSIALAGSRAWRASLGLVDSRALLQERMAVFTRLLRVSTVAAISLLSDGCSSPVASLDPIGAEALAMAGEQRQSKVNLLGSVKDRLLQALPGKSKGNGNGSENMMAKLQMPEALDSLDREFSQRLRRPGSGSAP